ncbi:hypothetical protein ED733_006480 [Metarhizium rileyi]|uniref:DNA double-strand break repair and VJ recombination XRCC4 n=1 Tax=Metarhizium rileyi (strain RCEF 4871) TaxID=1649241 RepID=A0A5C6GP06_METRR|nr:hypothetical protein ED733_006480 [Metarhizium rileyi]
MTANRVLKFPQSDDESSFFLVQVSSKGSKPLDLKLLGTEGEAPYACSLRHDRVSSLRVKNCPVSETEWQTILQSVLGQQPRPDIQVSATVQSRSSISLVIRRQVEGFTQRLGSVTLNYNGNEAIELFEWCAASVDAVTQAKESSSASASQVEALQSSVDELKAQLDELVAAKQEDEVAMLQKFRDLLNEKKVKIREQQKIITELSANSIPTEEVEEKGEEQRTVKARKKACKRKAQAVENESSEEDVAVTPVKEEPDVSGGDDDDDDGADNTTEVTASVASEDEEADLGRTTDKTAKEPAPPPRALPFQKKKKPVAADDSDDEEL